MSPDNVRYISAHYVIAGDQMLDKGIVTVDAGGTVLDVADTSGSPGEPRYTEFYNGILVPGFVNCHCHLELSALRGTVPENTGLPAFLATMRKSSDSLVDMEEIKRADRMMTDGGIVLCADICNSSTSFAVKKESEIVYHNLIEVFGSRSSVADERIAGAATVVDESTKVSLPFSVVPHSAYSVSRALLKKIKDLGRDNVVSSIHFMESLSEVQYLSDRSGPLAGSFMADGLMAEEGELCADHLSVIDEGIRGDSNLLLVHNTYVDTPTIRKMEKRNNTYWCLCPNSNLYIENTLPPVGLLLAEGATPVIGTDSLASNHGLSIMEELKTLQYYFPELNVHQLITWATTNGAKALGRSDSFGTIEIGKRPGILLLEGVDLAERKLLPGSTVRRLA